MQLNLKKVILLVGLVISISSVESLSQALSKDVITHASTYTWSKNNRIQGLDRSHSLGEVDRGFRAVITTLTTHEYEMDFLSYAYSFVGYP